MATTEIQTKQPSAVAEPANWRSFYTEMERLFDRFANGFGMSRLPSFGYATAADILSPVADIVDEEACYKITAEVPGLTEKDVDVSLAGDTLTVKGEKRQEREQKTGNYRLTERSYGAFRRSFMLPEGVDREKIAASVANGVLTVTLPKTPQAKPKAIEVKATA